jgi:hypothetical protein
LSVGITARMEAGATAGVGWEVVSAVVCALMVASV